jgi:FixJ family two-component response regulator
MSQPVPIHLVEDDPHVRRAIARLFETLGHEVRTYTSAEDFLRTAALSASGCAIIDLLLPGMNGLELQTRLAKEHPSIGVVFLTGNGNPRLSSHARGRNGASYLEKPSPAKDLLAAVGSAMAKAATRAEHHRRRAADRALLANLTPRELETLRAAASGMADEAIAAKLGITTPTAKVHLSRAMKKTGTITREALRDFLQRTADEDT